MWWECVCLKWFKAGKKKLKITGLENYTTLAINPSVKWRVESGVGRRLSVGEDDIIVSFILSLMFFDELYD